MSGEFIVAHGTRFEWNSQPLRLAGANNYYLGFAPDSMVRPVFELARRMQLNVLRTWAFLDCGPAAEGDTPRDAKDGVFFQYWNSTAGKPGFNDGPTGLERLDRTIAMAEEFGVRLILPLVNYWKDFGGVPQYLKWFGLTEPDEFYRNANARQAYREYVEHLLLRTNSRTGRHYLNEPAILAWELANEPRCVSHAGAEILLQWIDEMSRFLKSIDRNHLVGVGDEGYFHRRWALGNVLYNGSLGVDCERILSVPTVDFGTCHLYPSFAGKEDSVAFGAHWIREHIEAGNRANKPMLIEEYGYKAESASSSGPEIREGAFRTWLDQANQSGGAGALLWMIAAGTADGAPYPDYDGYTVYTAEEVPSLVAYARAGE